MKNPPTDERILGRLIQADEDCHPVVKKRLKKHKELLPVIEEHYGKVSSVRADSAGADQSDRRRHGAARLREPLRVHRKRLNAATSFLKSNSLQTSSFNSNQKGI